MSLRCLKKMAKPNWGKLKQTPWLATCVLRQREETVGEHATVFSRNTSICLFSAVGKSFFTATGCSHQGRHASCWWMSGRRKRRRGEERRLFLSQGVSFTSQCGNVFRTAVEVWFCWGLAERREITLGFLSSCPSERSAAVTLVTGVLWELRLLVV